MNLIIPLKASTCRWCYYPIGGKDSPRKLGNDGFGRGNLQISTPPNKGQKHLRISHFRLMEEVLACWVGQVIISMICFGSSFHPKQESQESTNVPYCIRSFLQLTGISNQKLALKSGDNEFCWSSWWVGKTTTWWWKLLHGNIWKLPG